MPMANIPELRIALDQAMEAVRLRVLPAVCGCLYAGPSGHARAHGLDAEAEVRRRADWIRTLAVR